MHDDDLDRRLAALEARAPSGDGLPSLARQGPRRLSLTPLGIAAALGLTIAASAVATAAIIGLQAEAYPGVENPGQPLHGANLECMSPPDAGAYIARHGFDDVIWQVETGRVGEKGSGSSSQQASPPEHGYVVPGSILSDGSLIMIVDQRDGATGTGACPKLRMP